MTSDPRRAAPADAWLASLGVGPPCQLLPPGIRWLAREDAARLGMDLPEDAAGAIVYAFEADGRIGAVQLEALDGEGRPPATRWRCVNSTMRGAAFHLPGPDGPGYPVHVATAPPVNALAIAT